jgi:predicted RNA-binding Zn-ribbon protein involved in translation (DUF1610 family)
MIAMANLSRDINKIKIYRRLGLLTIVLGMIITAITSRLEICPWIPYTIFIVSVVMTIILLSQYKCPHCGKALEWRISPEKQKYCYQCGKRIDGH